MKPKLLYYSMLEYQPETLERLKNQFDLVELATTDDDGGADLSAIEVAMAPRGVTFDRAKIDRMPRLQVIASSTLSVPHVDVEYAESKGVAIVHLGGERAFMERITATAELAWGLVIAVTRHLPEAVDAANAGRWGGRPFGRKTPRMLSAMSLGVIGLGRLGARVAAYGAAFGMRVNYFSPNSRNDAYRRCESLIELAALSDIVSLHAHHTPDTNRLIGDSFFDAMPPGGFFVNTARGEIVDETALLRALESGRLAGAALDVISGENNADFAQTLAQRPLVTYAREHTNLILTPHYAGATRDAWIAAEQRFVGLLEERCSNV